MHPNFLNRIILLKNLHKTSMKGNRTFFFPFIFSRFLPFIIGLPWWLSGKESTCNTGGMGSIPGSGRSPEEGNSNPFQYSCLGNPRVREAWQNYPHGGTRVRHNFVTKPLPSHLIIICKRARVGKLKTNISYIIQDLV